MGFLSDNHARNEQMPDDTVYSRRSSASGWRTLDGSLLLNTVKETDAAKAPAVAAQPTSGVGALLSKLTDESAESSVRRDAALKIGAMTGVEAADVALVVAELANPHNCQVGGGALSVRRAALLAFTELAQGGGSAAVAACAPAVAALLQYDDADAREMAVRAMGALGSHADALAVAACLEDAENDVRSAAADTLVVLRDVLDAAALDAVAARLRYEDDDEVRCWALRVLAGLGPAAAVAASSEKMAGCVIACLHDEGTMALTPPSRALALAALAALGRAESATATRALVLPLVLAELQENDDNEAMVKAAALEALAQLGDPETHADVVSELLCDPDRSVRSAANAALKRWGVA